MIRWIAVPLLWVALMFAGSHCYAATSVGFSVGVGDGYTYYPYNDYYTNYYPYTYDTYGYYTPSYNYNTSANWYLNWYGDSHRDTGYWRGSGWDGGRRGSWDGRGTYSGRGGFVGRRR